MLGVSFCLWSTLVGGVAAAISTNPWRARDRGAPATGFTRTPWPVA